MNKMSEVCIICQEHKCNNCELSRFKIGMRAIKARPYSEDKYCKYGGDEDSWPLGDVGEILKVNIKDNSILIRLRNCAKFCKWSFDPSELDLI